jgi:zinc transport system substrate-binding protein
MKKISILLILILNTLLFSKTNVVVSIIPQKSFVDAIGGKFVHTTVMVPPGSSPHTYEPKPSQMREISKANIYFSIDIEFEKAWLPRFKNQNKKMLVVDLAHGITKIQMPAFKNTNKKEEERDPHIWTSLTNIKIIALHITRVLSKFDKKHTDYYKKNYDNFIAKINKTDKKIRKILEKTKNNTKFMVFHPSWGYFAKEYNLTQFPIEIQGKTPKPKELIYIIKKAKDEHIKAIFSQPEFSDKIALQIAKELQIPVIKATPLSPDWAKNLINFARAIAR